MHRCSHVWISCCCQQWLHEHGHLLPANPVLYLHLRHSLEAFFRRLTQGICHVVSSHHRGCSFFHSMHVTLCVAFPHIFNWQMPVHCWLCYHPCLESCHVYIKEQRYEDSHTKIVQMELFCQILLTRSVFGLLKLYIHLPVGHFHLGICHIIWCPDQTGNDIHLTEQISTTFAEHLLNCFYYHKKCEPTVMWHILLDSKIIHK